MAVFKNEMVTLEINVIWEDIVDIIAESTTLRESQNAKAQTQYDKIRTIKIEINYMSWKKNWEKQRAKKYYNNEK